MKAFFFFVYLHHQQGAKSFSTLNTDYALFKQRFERWLSNEFPKDSFPSSEHDISFLILLSKVQWWWKKDFFFCRCHDFTHRRMGGNWTSSLLCVNCFYYTTSYSSTNTASKITFLSFSFSHRAEWLDTLRAGKNLQLNLMSKTNCQLEQEETWPDYIIDLRSHWRVVFEYETAAVGWEGEFSAWCSL